MREFLALEKESLTPGQLGFAYHCVSVCQYQTDKIFPALEYAKRAEEQAILAGNDVLLGRIWSNLIACCMDIGDTHLAVEYGEKWLANIDRFPELRSQTAKVHFNLAQTFRVRKEFSRMFEHFDLGMTYIGDMPVSLRVHFHQVYAWCLYSHERIAEGDFQAQRAGELVEESDVEGIREHLLLKGYRAYQMGDVQNAMHICEEFIVPDAPTTKRQEFWALWMIGMAACDFGNFEHGMAISALTLDLATSIKHSEFINRASELRRRAYRLGTLHSGDDPAG
jgi:hypothetical protein